MRALTKLYGNTIIEWCFRIWLHFMRGIPKSIIMDLVDARITKYDKKRKDERPI